MAISITDLEDLLKQLIQSTQNSAPDNPAEVLNAYDGVLDEVGIADALTLPYTPHAPAYAYGDAASMYGRAEWS